MSAFGYQYRNNVIRSDPVREPSPVVPLINRFAPLHGDVRHPVGSRRESVRNYLIKMVLSKMIRANFSAESIIEPVLPLLQGSAPEGNRGCVAAQEDEPCGAVDALVEESEPGWRRQLLARAELDDRERIGREPVGAIEGFERRGGETASVRGIDKRHRALQSRTGRTSGVTRHDLGVGALPERRNVPAQDRDCLEIAFDKDCLSRAARQRFEPERSGPGEGVEHSRAG